MARTNKQGDQIAQIIGGKYSELIKAGVMFCAPSNTALAIPIFSTPTNSPTLWNPLDSKRVAVITKIGLALAAGTTIPDSGLGILMSFNMGSKTATGQPFATFTPLGTQFNLKTGEINTGKCQIAVVETWTTIPRTTRWLGKNQFTLGTAAAAGFGDYSLNFDGDLILFPGQAISIVSSVASVTTFMPSFEYAEINASLF